MKRECDDCQTNVANPWRDLRDVDGAQLCSACVDFRIWKTEQEYREGNTGRMSFEDAIERNEEKKRAPYGVQPLVHLPWGGRSYDHL